MARTSPSQTRLNSGLIGRDPRRPASARRRLREATEAEFTRSLPEQQLRATIEWGYFDADIGHEAAALKLNVSRATCFRRLAEAVERVTIRLGE